MELTRLIVTKPDGSIVGDVDPTRVLDATFVHEVNGEHSLTITTLDELTKNDRILWRDGMGVWHENVVDGIEGTHSDGDTLHTYWCPWSLMHDLAATIVTAMPGTGGTPASARTALEAALGGTNRWTVGTVTMTSLGSASMWRVSGWEAMQTLVEVWGGELSTSITVGLSGVTARKVSLLEKVGNQTPTRRFDYGGDLTGITRTVSDQPWTCRVYPLGKAEETEGGGYGRKITIESVNAGVPYLYNTAVIPLVRVPDGQGDWEYPVQIVENDAIDSPADLKAWALDHLDEWTLPKVSYEMDVLQLAQVGVDATGVAEGDAVTVIDREFSPEGIAIQGRALRIEGSLLDPAQTTVTISNLVDTLGDSLGGIARSVTRLADMQTATALYQSTAAYLSELLGRLNDEANATGGYTYITEGEGLRTYDAAVTDPLVGAEASKVVEIKGGTIRIADSRTSGGDWDWKTVFTSGHVAAELVTAAQLTAGHIGSAQSGNYWDLDTGDFRMSSVTGFDLSATNLIRNGDFSNALTYWTGTNTTRTCEADSDFGHVLKAVQSDAGSTSNRVYSTNWDHVGGRTYSICFWAKADAANTLRAGSGGWPINYEAIGTTWKRYTGTWTPSGTLALTFYLGNAGTLYLADVMIVEGIVPMLDWGPDPRDALVPVDQWLTQTETFNRLTNNGALQGLYMSGGQLYVNGTYIKANSIEADKINVTDLQAIGATIGGFKINSTAIFSGTAVTSNADNAIAMSTADFTRTIDGTSRSGLRFAIGDKLGITGDGVIYAGGANISGDVALKKQVTVVSGTNDVAETVAGSIGAGGWAYIVISGGSSAYAHSNIPGLKVSNKSTSGSVRSTIMLAPQRTSASDAHSAIFTSGPLAIMAGIGDNESVTAGGMIQLNSNNIRMSVRGATETTYSTLRGVQLTNDTLKLGTHTTTYDTLGLDVGGNGYIFGTFTVNGTKSRCVDTEGYNTRLLYCDETPTPMFTDVGGGVTDADGECVVMVDPIFAETARTDLAYHVFLQPCGEGTLYVAEKAAGYFVVRGTANLAFDWQLKARQLGYESERLEDMDMRDERDAMGSEDTSIEELYADEFAGLFDADDMYDMDTYEDEEEAA